MPLKLMSAAFDDGGMIPRKHACDGMDTSPALAWTSAPGGTESFALIVDDPDAPKGTFTHWILFNFNVPATDSGLPASVENQGTLDDGSRQGTNGFRKVGYGGPCPPSGTHRYFFKLYALDTTLALPPGISKEELTGAMQGHVLGEAELMGRYAKQ